MKKLMIILTVTLISTASFGQISLPWSCDFATGDCGAIYENDTGGAAWAFRTTNGCPARSMYHGYSESFIDNDFVVWGPFTTPSADVINLHYDLSISNYSDQITVMCITNTYVDPNTTTADWMTVEGPIETAQACVQHNVDLSAVLGSSQFWIAFRYVGLDLYYAYIDNLSLTYSFGATATPSNTPTPLPGQDCSSAIVINIPGDMPYSQSGTTCGLLNEYAATCLGNFDGGEDIIYQLNVASEAYVDISYTTTDNYTGILLDDSCPPGPVTCIDQATSSIAGTIYLSGNLLSAGVYFLMLDSWPAPDCISSFTLTITCSIGTPTPTPTIYGHPGDTCGEALPLDCGDCVLGSTVGMDTNFDCGSLGGIAGGPDVVYTFTLSERQTVHIKSESNEDLDWALSDVCDASTATYTCSDTAGEPDGSETSCGTAIIPDTYGHFDFIQVLDPGTYYIWVDTYGTFQGGEFALELLCSPPPTPCVTCPSGGIAEGEPVCGPQYIDAFNGGCNTTPTLFQPVTAGETICGECGTYTYGATAMRDMDWYIINIPFYSDLIVEVLAEFPAQTLIAPAECPPTTLITSASDVYCTEFTATAPSLAPGDYYVVISPIVYSGIECGTRYLATFSTIFTGTPTPSPTAEPTIVRWSEDFEACDDSGHSMTIVDNYYNSEISGLGGPDGNVWVCTSMGGGCSSDIGLHIDDIADPINNWNEDYAVSPVINFDPNLDTLHVAFDLTTRASGYYDSWMTIAYNINPDADIYDQSTWDGSSPDGDILTSYVSLPNTCASEIIDLSFLCVVDSPDTVRLNFWNESGDSAPDLIDNIVVYQHAPPDSTPLPTFTPGNPTSTPSNTPSFTSTPTATPTPPEPPYSVWTPTVGRPSPSPTPSCGALGSYIYMPSHHFHPGDPCEVIVLLCNPGESIHSELKLFVILDVFGTLLFAPSFSSIDYFTIDLHPGSQEIQIVPAFSWPTGAGAVSGLVWYAGMTTPTMSDLVGSVGLFDFGWSE